MEERIGGNIRNMRAGTRGGKRANQPTIVTALTPALLPKNERAPQVMQGFRVSEMGDEGLEPPTSRM
jgi:hypothetical protein